MPRGPVRQLAKWGTPRALTGPRRWWTAARWPTALDRLPRALREFRAKWSASEPLIALRRLPHTLSELPEKWSMPGPLPVLNPLLVGISVVFSIQLLWGFAAPAPLPLIRVDRPLVAVVSAKKDSGPAGPPLTAYGGIAARNLFNPDRSQTGPSHARSGDPALPTKPGLSGGAIGEETPVAY